MAGLGTANDDHGSDIKFVKVIDILSGKVSGRVAVRGWVYRHRSTGAVQFIVIRDSTGAIQTTLKKGEVTDEKFALAEKLHIESSVVVVGDVREDKRAPGGYEIAVRDLKPIHIGEPFPITKDMSEDYLLDVRHLWVRSREQNAVMKVKASVLKAAREWFNMNDFYEVTPPIITPSACEGGATVFAIDYFGNEAYLSQSAQMYLEALIFSLERVWSLTPSFRAEKSRTPRHIVEFWHLEAEEAWVGNGENMKIQEELLSHICQRVVEWNEKELAFLGRDVKSLRSIEPPFPRIKYDEAIEFLQSKGFSIEWGDDFGAREEKALTIEESMPLFIINYPKEIKAFYMKENPEDPRTYLCSDLLAPEGYGEIIGASERETDPNKLIERLKREGANLENYEWYIDLRRYGSVPHSGFGMGIERVVRWLCKLQHVRDAVPFPRTPSRYYP
ncbi:MAG: asparagine--tRNA ligase [Thermoplasmata archaeon]|nr:MAG: asparagine--tRNA ligase [Thermoplasmata archaeon]